MSWRTLLLSSAATLALTGAARAAPVYSAVFAFGHSLSDAGNMPEPTSLALSAGGVAGVVLLRRRAT